MDFVRNSFGSACESTYLTALTSLTVVGSPDRPDFGLLGFVAKANQDQELASLIQQAVQQKHNKSKV